MNAFCAITLVCASIGKSLPLGLNLKDQQDFHAFYLPHSNTMMPLYRLQPIDLQ